MSELVSNTTQFFSGLDKAEKRLVKLFRMRIRILMSEGMRRMVARTPVHSGQAVMSYAASTGTPKPTNKSGYTPVEATNKLSLGSEKLRSAAASVALATLSAVDTADPFQAYYITNSAPHIGGLEYGALPFEPYTPRSPAGMFRVTNQELITLLSSGKI